MLSPPSTSFPSPGGTDLTTDRIAALEALLAETEAAHGVYESTDLNGVYDQDWPRWYAGYAVEHGIGSIVGRDVDADELAQSLAASWDELQGAERRPMEPWGAYTARRLAEELSGS
jgi:hypothetical protein